MPNYTNSDIFNTYIKIAEETGLTSVAQDADDSKKALDKNPRADSLTKEKISKLYGLKPDLPKDMQYERNIIERAHPNPQVVAPAYDRLNALFENNNERQNILLNIVNKRNNGLLTQHKYAQDDLALSLVRIANYMDNKNEDELRTLADDCLQELKKKADRGVTDVISDWLGIKPLSGEFPTPGRIMSGMLRTDVITIPLGAIIGAFTLGPRGIWLGAQAGGTAGLALGGFVSWMLGTGPKALSIGVNSEDAKEKAKYLLDTNRINNAKNIALVQDLINIIDGKDQSSNENKNIQQYSIEYDESVKDALSKADRLKGASQQEIVQEVEDIKPNENYLRRISRLRKACIDVLRSHESIKKDFDTTAKGERELWETTQKVRDYFRDILRNVPIEAYAYERFVDGVSSLYDSIDQFISEHKVAVSELEAYARQNEEQVKEKLKAKKPGAVPTPEELPTGVDDTELEESAKVLKFKPKSTPQPSSQSSETESEDNLDLPKAAKLKQIVQIIKNS